MAFQLPELPYRYDALEPTLDARTMELHHDKHHRAYVDKLNKALEGQPQLAKLSLEQLLIGLASLPDAVKTAVKNNAGQHYNHSLYWTILTPKSGQKPSGALATAIETELGGFETFKKNFSETAVNHFGSGWAFLSVEKGGKLAISGMHDGDCPVSHGMHPLMTFDVWEHAYYLKYQNKRKDYVDAIWNVLNWDEIARRYDEAKKK